MGAWRKRGATGGLSASVLPDGHWRTAECLLHLGLCLTELERYDEAKAALVEAHRTFEAALGAAHRRTLMAVAALIDLYDTWGKPEPAAEWRAKLPAEQEAVASDAAQPADDKQDD